MKKLILLLACAFTLVGCGGDKEDAKGEGTEKTEGLTRVTALKKLGSLGFTPEELKENWK